MPQQQMTTTVTNDAGACVTTATLLEATATKTITTTTNPCLPLLGGVVEVREEIGAFVGIFVGAELRRLRAVGPAIASVDWRVHDQAWGGNLGLDDSSDEEWDEWYL